MTPLETPRLIIREFTRDDLIPLGRILGDRAVMEYSANGPMDAAAVQGFFDFSLDCYRRDGFGQWAVEGRESGDLLGFAGISPVELEGRREVELAYRLAPRYWGRGVASEAGAAVLQQAFGRFGLDSVVAIVPLEHRASRGVARRLGLTFESRSRYRGWQVAVYRKTARD